MEQHHFLVSELASIFLSWGQGKWFSSPKSRSRSKPQRHVVSKTRAFVGLQPLPQWKCQMDLVGRFWSYVVQADLFIKTGPAKYLCQCSWFEEFSQTL